MQAEMEAQRHRRAVSEYHRGNVREEQIPRYPEFPLYAKYHHSLPTVSTDLTNEQSLKHSVCITGVPGKAVVSEVFLCYTLGRHKQFFSQRRLWSRTLFAVVSVMPKVNS